MKGSRQWVIAFMLSAQSLFAAEQVIDLPLGVTMPLAVFVHAGQLFIAVDNAGTLSAQTFQGALQKAGIAGGEHTQQILLKHGEVLYAPVGERGVSVSKTALDTLQLHLHAPPTEATQLLLPALKKDEAQHYSLSFAARKTSALLSLRDPFTGAMLHIALHPELGMGSAGSGRFVDLQLLPTAQGLAVIAFSDAVTAELTSNELHLGAAGGLTFSGAAAKQLKAGDNESENLLLFPYARWKLSDEATYAAEQSALFRAITTSPSTPEGRQSANATRERLLHLYLAEGLFPEARGMADDILRVSYKYFTDHHIGALRGAALLFMGHTLEASQDFAADAIAALPEIKLWRALAQQLSGEKGESFDFIGNYTRYIRHYPPSFIEKLALVAADQAINDQHYDTASAILDMLSKEKPKDSAKKYSDYMQAKIFAATGNQDEANKIWELQSRDIDDPLIRARATYSLITLGLASDKINPQRAITQLDNLRIVWRGDLLEVSVLRLLADLYIQQKQYAKALHALRDIVQNYPQLPDALQAAEKMEALFVALYEHEEANALPPLDALALFYEFRDLVPAGSEGDRIIRRLADRLAGIDLLDRAAQLLDHQVHKRLQGDERSIVGTRLALVYLMNHQPQEALETLKITGYGDVSNELQLTRLHLTAQALSDMGKPDRAIGVLANDTSQDGLRLRLSIYWDNKDWPNVIGTAEEMLGNRADPSQKLTKDESAVLLQLATAYVYQRDTGQIEYLRDYFTPLLKGNPDLDSFLFITSESGRLDYGNLNTLDQDIRSMRSFLGSYRDKMKKNGLSGVI